MCDCYYPFHLTSMIYDLREGEYSIVLVRIEGDTVGTTVVTIEESWYVVELYQQAFYFSGMELVDRRNLNLY